MEFKLGVSPNYIIFDILVDALIKVLLRE